MKGQLSLFDIRPDNHKRRPCEYSFKRYIGQRVKFRGQTTGVIKSIEPYYTIISTSRGELAGTPTTIWPVEEE